MKAVTGVSELMLKLKRVSAEIATAHQVKAVNAALKPVKRRIASYAPVGSVPPRGGRSRIPLARSVRSKVRTYRNGLVVFGIVGPTAPHAHLQELGWKQRGGGTVAGKHFAERAANDARAESQEAYLKSLRASLKGVVAQSSP